MITENMKTEIAALQSEINMYQIMYTEMIKNNTEFAQLKPVYGKMKKLKHDLKKKAEIKF